MQLAVPDLGGNVGWDELFAQQNESEDVPEVAPFLFGILRVS